MYVVQEGASVEVGSVIKRFLLWALTVAVGILPICIEFLCRDVTEVPTSSIPSLVLSSYDFTAAFSLSLWVMLLEFDGYSYRGNSKAISNYAWGLRIIVLFSGVAAVVFCSLLIGSQSFAARFNETIGSANILVAFTAIILSVCSHVYEYLAREGMGTPLSVASNDSVG